MNRKNLFIVLSLAFIAVWLSGCDSAGKQGYAAVNLAARLDATSARAIVPGSVVTDIDGYRVAFKKVEIGNSESDKFTLWESPSPEGTSMDITAPVSFENVNTVVAGTYNYVRFTIGTTLGVDGSIVEDSITYTGTGSVELAEDTYLFGVDIPNDLGEATVTAPVVITDGMTLALEFDAEGTVTYQSGTAEAAVFGVAKPVLTVVSE